MCLTLQPVTYRTQPAVPHLADPQGSTCARMQAGSSTSLIADNLLHPSGSVARLTSACVHAGWLRHQLLSQSVRFSTLNPQP